MKLAVLDQWIVVLYLLVVMGIGFAMKRRAAQGMSAFASRYGLRWPAHEPVA